MLAQVNNGLGPKAVLEPAIKRQVVVGGLQVGGVIVEGGVAIVAPAGLDADEDVAELEAGDGEGKWGSGGVGKLGKLGGGGAPAGGDAVANGGGERLEVLKIIGGGQRLVDLAVVAAFGVVG